jgi:hypothetical protein
MNTTTLLNEIKAKAMQNFKECGKWYGAHTEDVAGRSVQAYVIEQNKNGRRNVLVCNWYLDNKKTSLAKVVEALS